MSDPYTDPLGPETGTVTILGGVEGSGGYDPTTQDVLGSSQFQIDVVDAPEPAPVVLLAGLGAIVLLLRILRIGGSEPTCKSANAARRL